MKYGCMMKTFHSQKMRLHFNVIHFSWNRGWMCQYKKMHLDTFIEGPKNHAYKPWSFQDDTILSGFCKFSAVTTQEIFIKSTFLNTFNKNAHLCLKIFQTMINCVYLKPSRIWKNFKKQNLKKTCLGWSFTFACS